MRLNLGCGGDILDNWTNVDLYPARKHVVQGDIRALPFSPGTIEAIRAIDVLEHIPRRDVQPTLAHWFSLLQQGGTVEIRCPDAKKQCELLVDGTWTPEIWAHMMFGGQDNPGNFHNAGFTQESLSKMLVEVGFRITECKAEHHEIASSGNANFRITATKP